MAATTALAVLSTSLGATTLLASATALPAAAASTLAPGTAVPGGTDPMTGVHVVHPSRGRPYLADSAGQMVLLRGVDDNALVQYPKDYPEAPTISPDDLREMAALGFDFLRLPVSWSRIMPAPGHLDQAYLKRVASVVRWAATYGIGVLIDMHEDNYSVVTDEQHEADGAPPWAVLDHGTPCTAELSTTACALAAFASFWADRNVDGRPLQRWYLEATTAVARAAGADRSTSNVVGVELMNEPWPAGTWPAGSTFEQSSLYPFYRRMIAGLRAGGVTAPLWFEPSILRDATDDALPQAARFSSDPDLVYAVHIYTGVFSPPYSPTASIAAMQTSYANAAAEAAVFGTPWVVDEFGSNATPAWSPWLDAQLGQQNAHLVGSGFWLWKQRKGPWDNWAVVHLSGALRTGSLRAQLLARPHIVAVPGRLLRTKGRAETLTASVDGPGGTGWLWGGTVVARGGTTLTTHTTKVITVDGRPVPATCHRRVFDHAGLHLTGCLMSFKLSPGSHLVTAGDAPTAAPPEGTGGR